MTTVDDLKRSIDAIDREFAVVDIAVARATAWRTAFDWMKSINDRLADEIGAYTPNITPIVTERDKGLALIKEKLS